MSEPVVVRCREHGPYVIKGPIQLVDHTGVEFIIPAGKDSVALCRCGQSQVRPFCDGSHRTCGFQAADLADPTATA